MSSGPIGEAFVTIRPETAAFESDLTSKISGALKAVGLAVGAAFAVNEIKSFVAEAQVSNQVLAQTEAVLKSTGGVAGVTAGHINELANSISAKTGIDDEAIQSTENLLLTFTNLKNQVGKGNDIFDQATKSVTDMSVALGEDPKSAAIQLGKALQDPILGITALRRVGVNFNDSQKDVIKNLVNTGHTLEAQKLILKEINTEFGGSAEAVATPLKKLRVQINNLKEDLGKKIIPVLNTFAGALSNFLPKAVKTASGSFNSFFQALLHGDVTSSGFNGTLEKLGNVIRTLYDDVQPLLKLAIIPLAAAFEVAYKIITKTIDYLFDHKDGLQPVVDVLVGLGAALLGLKIANDVAGDINTAVSAIGNLPQKAKDATAEIKTLVTNLGKVVSKTVNLAVSGAEAAKSAIGGVVDKLGGLVNKTVEVTAKVTEPAKDKVKEVGKSIASGLIGGIAGGLISTEGIAAFGAALLAVVTAPAFLVILGTVGVVLAANLLSKFGKEITQTWPRALGRTIGGALQSAVDSIGDIDFGKFFGPIGRFFENLPGEVGRALTSLPGIMAGAFNSAIAAIPGIIAAIPGFFAALPGQIIDVLGALPDVLIGFFSALPGTIAGAVSSVVDAIIGFFSRLPNDIVAAITPLPLLLAAGAVRAMGSFLGGLFEGMPGIIKFFTNLPGTIVDAIGDVTTKLTQKGKDFIGGFAKGIKDAAGSLPDPVKAGIKAAIPGIGLLFDKGGIVPGAIGAPVPAIVHGGEVVLNRQQQMNLLNGRNVNYEINITQAGAGPYEWLQVMKTNEFLYGGK